MMLRGGAPAAGPTAGQPASRRWEFLNYLKTRTTFYLRVYTANKKFLFGWHHPPASFSQRALITATFGRITPSPMRARSFYIPPKPLTSKYSRAKCIAFFQSMFCCIWLHKIREPFYTFNWKPPMLKWWCCKFGRFFLNIKINDDDWNLLSSQSSELCGWNLEISSPLLISKKILHIFWRW